MDSDEFTESEYSDDEEIPSVQTKTSVPKPNRHLAELKSKLGLAEFKDKAAAKREKRKRQKANRKLKRLESSENGVNIIKTKGTQSNPKAAKIVPEVVTYLDPRKRTKQSKDNVKQNLKNSEEETQEVTMKQARFDVFKFGVKGFDKEGQHEARVALALKLGAKPEKKKCLPYVELKEKRKIEKEEKLRELELAKMTGMRKVSTRPSSTKNKKSSKENDAKKPTKKKKRGTEATPLKLGKFDGGTLKLSQKDLMKMKKKR